MEFLSLAGSPLNITDEQRESRFNPFVLKSFSGDRVHRRRTHRGRATSQPKSFSNSLNCLPRWCNTRRYH